MTMAKGSTLEEAVIQIEMAFVDALEKAKRAQERQQPQLQIEVDNRTLPLCERTKKHIYKNGSCVFCGTSASG